MIRPEAGPRDESTRAQTHSTSEVLQVPGNSVGGQ